MGLMSRGATNRKKGRRHGGSERGRVANDAAPNCIGGFEGISIARACQGKIGERRMTKRTYLMCATHYFKKNGVARGCCFFCCCRNKRQRRGNRGASGRLAQARDMTKWRSKKEEEGAPQVPSFFLSVSILFFFLGRRGAKTKTRPVCDVV